MIASLPLQAALWGLVAHGCRNLRDHCPPAPAGLVTRFLLSVDIALANTARDGYGHAYYGPDYVRTLGCRHRPAKLDRGRQHPSCRPL